MIDPLWQIELGPLFAYKLCAGLSLLIDENSGLRKGNMSGMVKRLSALQLFHHIVLSHSGSPSDLITSIQDRLSHYLNFTGEIIVFDCNLICRSS